MQPNNIIAIDVNLAGEVQSNDTAWLDQGEDIVEAIKGITNDGKTIIGFEFNNGKFGVIVK